MSERKHIQSLQFDRIGFHFENDPQLFSDLSVDFVMNKTIWLRSEGAEGKSTFLQLMSGLLVPTSGHYRINNEEFTDMSFEDFLPYRLNIGYSFDQGGLIHNRTIEENILLPLLYHKLMPAREAKKRAHEYMERLEIIDSKDLRPSYVRGRVRKMACLIRALVTHPDLLLLDDPSVGLDEPLMKKFVDIIDELQASGRLHSIYISSYDEKFMNLLNHQEALLDADGLHYSAEEDHKKVVNL